MQDDPRKKATPPAQPHTARYKSGNKSKVTKNGGKVGRKNLLTQANEHSANPLQALLESERKEPRKGQQHKVDPFMVRQAKLKARNA